MATPRTGMSLVFGDEFDRTDFYDQPVHLWDTSFFYGGRTLPSLYQKQYFLDRDFVTNSGVTPGIDPFAISNGTLSITADRLPTELVSSLDGRTYSGGLLTSFNSFSFQYGYVEITAQMPKGQGFWPALWLLRTDSGQLGEIDLAEVIGNATTTLNSTIHTSNDGVTQVGTPVVRSTVDDLSAGLHTYGVDWTESSITFYLDGVAMGQVATPEALKASMYLLANFSVGGTWGGDPNASTPFPSQMLIDSIRVYQDDSRPSTAAPRTLAGTDGNNTMAGGDAADTIAGNGGNDTFSGGAGGDSLSGGAGKDRIQGDSGNDTIDGGEGVDYMMGGLGDDTFLVDDPNDVVWEAAGTGYDTVLVTAPTYRLSNNPLGGSIERMIFTGSGDVSLTGSGSANAITGGAGKDWLDGGAGADTLEGLGSDDIYVVDDTGDRIVEVAGGGFDIVRTTLASYTLGAELEGLFATVSDPFKGTGNTLDNLLVGNAGADSLIGLGGSDTLWGRGGPDTLVGGAGNDIYVVDDVGVVVTEGSNAGLDSVQTSLSSYTLSGNIDTLVFTGTGSFRGVGNGLDNVIVGSGGADNLIGGAGHDTIHGDGGNDRLNGGLGNDRLYAGTGADTLTGDAGADVFVFAASPGPSTAQVTDFRHAEGDKLDMRSLGIASFADVTANLTQNGQGYAVIKAGGETVTLQGVAAATLVDSDFVFGPAPVAAPPTGLTVPQVRVSENSAPGTAISVLIGADSDPGDALTYSLVDDAGGLFAIAGRTLVVNGPLDYEASKTQSVTVRVTDEAGLTYDQAVTLNVLNVNEAPFGLTLSADRIPAGATPGTVVGFVGVQDPDLGDTPFLSLPGSGGGRFLIDNGKLIVAGPLDAASYDLSILATDSGGLTTQSTFTITVDGYWGGGPGNTITGTAGADVVSPTKTLAGQLYPTAGPDTVSGLDGNDTLDAGAGNDSLLGGAGSDSLIGGAGDDTLDGGAAADTLSGGLGNDTYVFDTGDVLSDPLNGGYDTVQTALASYTLTATLDALVFTGTGSFKGVGNGLDNAITGGAGNDQLTGGGGNDSLRGLAGNDRLGGGAGNDSLDGGDGADTVSGDAGMDVFTFSVPSGPSTTTVNDFTIGEDRLDMRALGLTDFASVLSHATSNASGNAVIAAAGETVTLQNVKLASLGDGDFIF